MTEVGRLRYVLAMAAAIVFAAPSVLAGQATAYDEWYEALRTLGPDADQGALVQNLMIMREGATFLLESGQLQLLERVDGRRVGAVWVGEGRFLMGPPNEVERAQLQRFYDTDRIDRRIRRAVVFFTGRPDELFPALSWRPMPPPDDGRREVEEAMRYLSDDGGRMHRDVAVPLMNDIPFFYAHVADDRDEPAMVMVTPLDREDVTLFRRAPGERIRESVLRYPSQADLGAGRAVLQEELDPVRVGHFDFSGTIGGNLDFRARATLALERTDARHDWIPLSLFSELDVDSMRWGDGSVATFSRPDDSTDLWIDFDGAPSESPSLTVYYRGDLFDRFLNSWVEMKSSTAWLPIYAAGRPATYRMTFRHHESYRIAAVGSRIVESEPDDDDMVTAVWETPEVRWATFNVGRFTEHTVGDTSSFELTVQVDEGAHGSLSRSYYDVNDLIGWTCPSCSIVPRRQSDMAERVARDLLNSFAFFEQVYGPTERDRFVATEIPYNHGEAHEGLVLLSWSTFHWTTDEGYDEIFRAHEVAHQWWGIGVRPATYRDRWLTEGFAQFSGLWYMGRVRGSLELLTDHLETTREEIWERREEAGPIWLGTRAASSEDPGDYSLMIYDKGAWVLHMLRVLLTDPNTGSDEAFEAMIKDFFGTYRGRAATTEQFREVVERHAGIPMDWFFNQWVYGTAIPEYHVSHRIEELPSGEYRATVRVRQEEVPETFQMIVPVYLEFGPSGNAQVNIVVSGPETVVELPVLPMEPLEVVFNPFESVLARVETEGWRD